MLGQATPTQVAEPATSAREHTTVLVGLDGSPTSWSALWWACGEAQRLDGRVIAVYVTGTTEGPLAAAALAAGFDTGTYATVTESTHAQRAAELQAELRERTGGLPVTIDFVHRRGDTADQLLRAACDVHADVIAVGRSTKLRHHLAGAIAHRINRSRNAPIVVVVP